MNEGVSNVPLHPSIATDAACALQQMPTHAHPHRLCDIVIVSDRLRQRYCQGYYTLWLVSDNNVEVPEFEWKQWRAKGHRGWGIKYGAVWPKWYVSLRALCFRQSGADELSAIGGTRL